MGYGASVAVSDAEDEYREGVACDIAMLAAELVAAGDMSRVDAIKTAVEHHQYCQEAESDSTGMISTLDQAQRPQPSREAPKKQIQAIADELIE